MSAKRWKLGVVAIVVGITAGIALEHGRPRPTQPLLWDLPGAIRDGLDDDEGRETVECVSCCGGLA